MKLAWVWQKKCRNRNSTPGVSSCVDRPALLCVKFKIPSRPAGFE